MIVEDHLGEGAFGMVFKGTIRGPLRNSKLSPKLKQSIAIPVAIKLLKGELVTAMVAKGFRYILKQINNIAFIII